jgi:hypothetical protein
VAAGANWTMEQSKVRGSSGVPELPRTFDLASLATDRARA